MIPGLGDHAGRLEQHAGNAERRIDFDEEIRLDPEKLGTKAVPLLDAAFGVKAIAAHVPLADAAGGTGNGIGPAHDADDEIAGVDAAIGGRRLHDAERFMPDHQPPLARRSPTVTPGYDFAVGAADPDCHGAHQNRAVRQRWIGNVFDLS